MSGKAHQCHILKLNVKLYHFHNITATVCCHGALTADLCHWSSWSFISVGWLAQLWGSSRTTVVVLQFLCSFSKHIKYSTYSCILILKGIVLSHNYRTPLTLTKLICCLKLTRTTLTTLQCISAMHHIDLLKGALCVTIRRWGAWQNKCIWQQGNNAVFKWSSCLRHRKLCTLTTLWMPQKGGVHIGYGLVNTTPFECSMRMGWKVMPHTQKD